MPVSLTHPFLPLVTRGQARASQPEKVRGHVMQYIQIQTMPPAPAGKSYSFDVPRALQGQTVEVAYCDGPTTDGKARGEHGIGDLYKRVTDRSTGEVTYYRRIDPDGLHAEEFLGSKNKGRRKAIRELARSQRGDQ